MRKLRIWKTSGFALGPTARKPQSWAFRRGFKTWRSVGGPGVRQAQVHIPALPGVWLVTLGKTLNGTQFLAFPLREVGVAMSISQGVRGLSDIMRVNLLCKGQASIHSSDVCERPRGQEGCLLRVLLQERLSPSKEPLAVASLRVT